MTAKLSASPLGYLLKEAFLIIAFVYFLLFANTWRAYADYDLIRNGVVLTGIATGVWLILALLKRWTAPTPLSLGLLLFLSVYTLTALTSIQPTRSLDEVWAFGMYAFGFALVAQLAENGWPPEVFTKALLIAGSLLMGISVYLALNWYGAWLAASGGQVVPDIAYRLPLANGQSTYLYLSLFIVIARWQVTPARLPRVLMVLWALPALFLLFLTASRGGWLATAAGLVVMASVYIRERGGWRVIETVRRYVQQRRLLALSLGVIGTGVLIGLIWVASRQLINPQKGPALLARVEFWVPAWNAFLQQPVFGQGPLTYGSAYLRYNSVPPYGFFAHAHNTTLNLLVESGLLGVVAFGVLAVATFVAVWKQVNTLSGQDKAVAIAALAGASAWAVHSLVDTVQVEPMNSLMLTVLLGAALGKQGFRSAPDENVWLPKVRTGWPVVLGLVLSMSGLYNLWRLLPLQEGVVAAQKNDWEAASVYLTEAVRRAPGSVIAQQQLGLVDGILASQGRSDSMAKAVSQYQTVVRLDPDWWLNHANLAALYETDGQTESALAEFRQASRLGYGSPLAQLNYGLAAEQAGDLGEARQAYSTTLALRPVLSDAYFWRANEFRKSVLSTWREKYPALPTFTLAEMQAFAQGGDVAQDYLPLAGEYIRVGRLREAQVLLQKAALAYFDTGDTRIEFLWLQAELAAGQGDYQLAVSRGKSAVDGYMAQSAIGPGSFGQAAYAEVFFREESMAVDLAPQLTNLPLTDSWADRWVTVGAWQAKLGESEAARETYQNVLVLVPDNQLALAYLR